MPATPTAADVATWRADLLGLTDLDSEADIVDLLGALEQLKSTACAIQADLAVALDDAVREREAAAGVAAARRGRGVAAQIGLARQESPHRGRILLGFARDLHSDLPATREALADGRLNEFRAIVIARETGCLDSDDRRRVDAELDVDGLGTGELAKAARRKVAAIDPAAVVRRARKAAEERCVTLRPAPDTMTYLTGLLPVAQAVAAFASLTREADRLRSAGDPRSKGQLMADLLVERLTGQTSADTVPVCVDLVISDETLLGAGHEPAEIPGHGPLPAQIARELVAHSLADSAVATWIRSLYASPTGRLVALTTRSRLATAGLADFVRLRDAGICRTPWCDAPVRHIDHVAPFSGGGPTSASNLQGLCEACNQAKEAAGWWHERDLDDPELVTVTTPTGRRHRSRAPALPAPSTRGDSFRLDIFLPAA